MEPKQNFKNYRQDIDKKAREVNNCVIPYLGTPLFLQKKERKDEVGRKD